MLNISTEWQTLTFKGFLWLAGRPHSSPVFFHWRNEWILSEFILLGPLADATTGLVNLINQSFRFNRGEGQIFRNQTMWFPSCFWSRESDSERNQHACGLIDQCWGLVGVALAASSCSSTDNLGVSTCAAAIRHLSTKSVCESLIRRWVWFLVVDFLGEFTVCYNKLAVIVIFSMCFNSFSTLWSCQTSLFSWKENGKTNSLMRPGVLIYFPF